MALVESQEVALKIGAETSGQAGVSALVDQIEALAREGDEAAPRFAEFAAEIRRLGQQKVQIDGLQDAVGAAKSAWSAVRDARREVEMLGKALGDARGAGAGKDAIKLLETELRNANRELNAAEKAWSAQKEAIRAARADLRAAGVDAANLSGEQKRLNDALAATAARVEQQRAAIAAANPALKTLGTSAEQANAALARIGVRSDAQIKAEINLIDQDLIRLAADARVSGAEFNRTWSAGQAQIARLRAELGEVPPQVDAIGRSATGVGLPIKNIVAGFVGIQTAAKFLEANVELEKMRRSILAVSGSSGEAAATMDFLRATAGRLGVDVGGLAGAYVSLSAATRGTSLAGAETQRIFASVTNAMASLGKGGAETERALQAVAQMSSKGVVSMEELRGQLGEALPGALQAASKQLGMTDQQLIKLVESGQLLSEEFLPVLRKGLDETFTTGGDKVQGFAAEWQRLKSALSDTANFVGDSGVMTAITTLADQGGTAVRGLTGAFELLGKIVGITFGAIATFDVSHPIDSMRNWKTAVSEAGDEIQAKMDKAKAAAAGSAEAQAKAGAAAAGAAGAMAEAAGGIKSNADAHAGMAKAAGDSAKAQIAAGTAARNGVADMADALAVSIKLKAAYKEVLDALAEQTKNTEKLADANRVASDTTVQLAAMAGNEAQTRSAAVAAAQSQVEWSGKVSVAKQNEASVIGAEIAAIQALAAAQGGLTQAQSEQVDALTKSMAAKQADADRAQASAEAAKLQEAQTRLNAEAAKDNAGRLFELRDAAAAAAGEVERLREAQAQGKATQDDVNKAAREAAIAQGLYRDALADQAAAIQANLSVKQAQNQLDQTNVQLAITVAQRAYELAKAKGDEKAATEELLHIKRLEVDVAELQAQALQAQAEAELLAIKNKREQAQASGTLTEQLKAELKAQQLSAEAKQVQGKISEEVAGKMRDLAAAAEESGTAIEGSMKGAANATGKVAEAASLASKNFWEMSEAARQAETDAERLSRWEAERGRGSVGTVGSAGYTERGAFEHAKQAGLSDSQSLQLAEDYMKMRNSIEGIFRFQEAIDKLVLSNARTRATEERSSATVERPPAPERTVAAPPQWAPEKVVQVNLSAGGREPVPVFTAASAADRLLKDLEFASIRSS